jgi:hypothetical protein
VGAGTVELSHEALLREWPRYRAWLEEDRAGRRLHAHLRVAAAEWHARRRDPGELYRGARLAAALEFAAQHPEQMDRVEREFVEASRLEADREVGRQRAQNRRLRALLVGAGVLLVLAGSLYLGPLYQSRFVPLAEDPLGNLRALLLPTLSVALPLAAMTAQMTRAALLEVLAEPFIVTARAKGLREQAIVYGHALKNALVPVVTLQGYVFGSLLGGLIVTEQVFNLPGLGRGLLTALNGRDYPLVIGGTLVIAASYVLVNLLVDLLYPVLDPAQAR